MENRSLSNFSVASLIITNFIPFFGVIFLGWSLFAVLFFYWSENIVIGFYNVLKMTRVAKFYSSSVVGEANSAKTPLNIMGAFFILFFIFHYGGFTLGHGVFVFAVFGPPDISILTIVIGIISLFISHGISYYENFINKEEYKKISPTYLFTQPYRRIMVMHVTIVLSGFAVKVLKLPLISILLLVVLKIVIDLNSHKQEHKKFQGLSGDMTDMMNLAMQKSIGEKIKQ
jgi:hypothetical protein